RWFVLLEEVLNTSRCRDSFGEPLRSRLVIRRRNRIGVKSQLALHFDWRGLLFIRYRLFFCGRRGGLRCRIAGRARRSFCRGLCLRFRGGLLRRLRLRDCRRFGRLVEGLIRLGRGGERCRSKVLPRLRLTVTSVRARLTGFVPDFLVETSL